MPETGPGTVDQARTQDLLESRIAQVGEDLRRTLTAVASAVSGAAIRPSRLVRSAGIDKSLASRLARGLRADSAFELMHLIPSPTGLRMFLDGARKARVSSDLCRQADVAVQGFQNLLDGLPGGRGALDALMSTSMVEVRDRGERSAKQAVFKAMSYLLGFHCETITSALILQPSADGARVDGVEVSHRVGIRRLRPTSPVGLFSIGLRSNALEDGPWLEALDGSRPSRDPEPFLMREFCSQPLPQLDIFEEQRHTIFGFSDEGLSLHAPVNVASALIVRQGWQRHRSPERPDENRTYLLHYPCKTLVRDLFVREDLYVGSLPEVRFEFPSPMGSRETRPRGAAERLNTLDLNATIEQLGLGLERTAVAGVPDHARLLSTVFERIGWDRRSFRGYRLRMVYPVPMITMGWWIPLPD